VGRYIRGPDDGGAIRDDDLGVQARPRRNSYSLPNVFLDHERIRNASPNTAHTQVNDEMVAFSKGQ
jgi:hypothetical protein